MGQMKKSTRKVGNQTYHLYGRAVPKKKSTANKEAKRLRKGPHGSPTIVVKCAGGYRVFTSYSGRKPRGNLSWKRKK